MSTSCANCNVTGMFRSRGRGGVSPCRAGGSRVAAALSAALAAQELALFFEQPRTHAARAELARTLPVCGWVLSEAQEASSRPPLLPGCAFAADWYWISPAVGFGGQLSFNTAQNALKRA